MKKKYEYDPKDFEGMVMDFSETRTEKVMNFIKNNYKKIKTNYKKRGLGLMDFSETREKVINFCENNYKKIGLGLAGLGLVVGGIFTYNKIKKNDIDNNEITQTIISEEKKDIIPDSTYIVPPIFSDSTIVKPQLEESISLEQKIKNDWSNLKLPDKKLPNSLSQKNYSGVEFTNVEKNLWSIVADHYNLLNNQDIANMVNYVAEFNLLNNPSERIKNTIGKDNLYVDDNGNVKKGEDGIKGDLTFNDERYMLPNFEEENTSIKKPNITNNIKTDVSTIDDITQNDDNKNSDNEKNNDNQIPYNALAISTIALAKRKNDKSNKPDLDAIAKTYNSNFTTGNKGIKNIMKKYETNEKEAIELLNKTREYNSINYSSAILSSINQTDLADSILLYTESDNNKKAMERIEATTGIKLHSTSSLYKLIDYAQNQLGINHKIRKTQLNKENNIIKENLYAQLNKYTNTNNTINTYKIAS